ncbi:MAG: hypothetical protein HQK51_04920 [Oligoflexia bacterium]|nr:hypothetical protein [Oligoflexia bacterium]
MNVKKALRILESAATEGSEDIKNIFSSDYQNLRRSIMGSIPNIAWDKVKHAKDVSIDYTVDKAKVLDKSVHKRAWYYIGGAALIAASMGFLFGRGIKNGGNTRMMHKS